MGQGLRRASWSEGGGVRRGGGLLFWGEAGFERRLCGAVVAAVPRKRSGNRRCVSWSKGTGCGGAESLSFGERTGSNGCSAGRWLLPLPGNGPGAGGVLLCRREQAAAGRRASLSGGGRIRTRHPSPPLFASAVRCYHPPPATTRRLPPLAACHYPPPATSAADCVLTACVSTVCRFSPLVITTCRPPLPPAACLLPPSPACHHPLLPAPPPLLTSRTRCLPFPPPCAGRADRWAAAAPRVVGRGAMRRRREVLRNNLENRKILPIFVSVKYRGSGLSRPGFLFFIGLSFLWQKRLSI